MPRTADVSSRVEVRWSLFSFKPISVWRWRASRRIGEPVWTTVTVFLAIGPSPLRFGAGRFGVLFWVKPGDVNRAAKALGAE